MPVLKVTQVPGPAAYDMNFMPQPTSDVEMKEEEVSEQPI